MEGARGLARGHRPLPPRGAGEEAPCGPSPLAITPRHPPCRARAGEQGGGLRPWPCTVEARPGPVAKCSFPGLPLPHLTPLPKHRECPVGPLDVEMGALLPRPCPEKLPDQGRSRDFQPCPCPHQLPAPCMNQPGSPDFSVLQPPPGALRLDAQSPMPPAGSGQSPWSPRARVEGRRGTRGSSERWHSEQSESPSPEGVTVAPAAVGC